MIYTDILEDDYKEDVWYPDDSGLWIETYGQDFKYLIVNKIFRYLTACERNSKSNIPNKFDYSPNMYYELPIQIICAIRIIGNIPGL